MKQKDSNKGESYASGDNPYLGQSVPQNDKVNKEFVKVEGATHCSLYDNYDFVPFDKM